MPAARKEYMTRDDFLPVSPADVKRRGWEQPDFVYVCGEAYVDHPSFGHAIISRVLENAGYKVAMLCLPPYQDESAFKTFGKPKLAFLVSAGVIDSMVNHYTAAKKRRSEDVYAPGGKAGLRPDRATIVYCNRIRKAYSDVPIIIGGLEASLRRFSHYDYWEDKVRHSILVDSGATILSYGMGEKSILDCAAFLRDGADKEKLPGIRGICYLQKDKPEGIEEVPSHKEVSSDKAAYASAFMIQYNEQDPYRGKALCQQQDTNRWLVQTTPAYPLSREELDAVYTLPYVRRWHPDYDTLGGVPALTEVEFSVSATRGCFGGCNFCALTYHQGRIVSSRSPDSIVKEAEMLTKLSGFKGYIHDVGGPTANFRRSACKKQCVDGACKDRQCLYPKPCRNLNPDHSELLNILRRIRALPGVKKVFIRSGLRYDYLLLDKDGAFLRELCQHHVSGQLKVAPEHISPKVLSRMGKPGREVYDAFVQKYKAVNEQLGLKQFLVPYLMSSHPGSDLSAAIELALYIRDTGHQPEQVQDFYPTPGTLSTCMFYTGLDPRTMESVFVPRAPHDKAMQRALLQYKKPQNRHLVLEALRLAGREDLIGYGKNCLVPPDTVFQPRPPRPAAEGLRGWDKERQDKTAERQPRGQGMKRGSPAKGSGPAVSAKPVKPKRGKYNEKWAKAKKK
jgi:uncharacterized radical SAM protein YgiQ